ncbi:NYN domain-containing protein [Aspergillus clavatus NRRL 1]|uniref:NYN domain-containing protein n=1 Tax=Aspergillus clavatus (strain ATCC 1007 / CBS 513.65 / DSM 816 / NCTC 3887 / NRRL 1 / QM 1276 / 107) TaxID=344612 RepID=A1CU86_ASPCL|nr:uncharacterized protein ACLA_085700 [Aspergillus clavatus NRRL 1]EAW06873.1 conserved hypothetical protein [Aspergillus clavatus NRRL 1]
MPSSLEPASNWDFTPVFNLLRSPSYDDREQSRPVRHTAEYTRSSANDFAHHAANKPTLESPRLGDFGPLWDLLGHSGSAASVSPVGQTSTSTTSPQVDQLQPCKPIQILQRPTSTARAPGNAEKQPSQTSPIAIPKNVSKPPRVLKKAVAEKSTAHLNNDCQSKITAEVSSLESSTEVESDSNSSVVFDPPVLKKQTALSFIPAQLCTPDLRSDPCDTPPSSVDESEGFLTAKTVKSVKGLAASPLRVQPTAYKSTTERRVGLLTKLLKKFPEYAETVAQVGRSPSTKAKNQGSRPIHVFVDMSNIMVGFHDSVKAVRNIPVKSRIPRLPLSFQNFSLILERGRPAAKRVLVGSDRFAAIDESQTLGYEANILERVHKVKYPTRRQLKYRKNPQVGAQERGSGSETNDMPEERWVEQGVDEILHLKILESLLDTDDSATIVLATGDAAEAEYSGGFMKMVERALQRGWNVELVSFSQGTSFAYRQKEFRAKWGKQFRIIALDEYVEELLDM